MACLAGSEDELHAFYVGVVGLVEIPKPPPLAAAVVASGCPVTWDEAIPGVRRFHTTDPVGNRVELQQV